ncbi:MAG: PKD domain-containing protein [Bacteroidota bacterium]
MKYLKIYLTAICILGILWSCGEDGFPVPQASSVVAQFGFSISNDGFAPATVTFNNETFTTDQAGTVTYSWNFGDGTSSNEATPSHLYTKPGTYTVSMTVTSENDLDFIEQQVTIKDPNALLVRLFFMDAVGANINEIDGGSIDVGGFGTGMAYDAVNEQIYYTNDDELSLVRVNLDGSNPEVISDVFAAPRDLALDIPNNKVYVADRGSGVNAIWEVDLTNNSANILYDNATHGLGELPVGLDLYNGNLYITCVGIDGEAVWVGNIDGTGVTRIIDFSAGGFGYGIAVDPGNEKIYFDNSDTGQIMRSDLDGSNIESIIDTENRVYGITIDNANNKFYWTERNSGSVFMTNLDGSDKVTLTSDFDDPRGIFFIE